MSNFKKFLMLKFKKPRLGKSVETFDSIIGASLKIDGNVVVSQSLRIDGAVHGNITQSVQGVATVAIAQTAEIIGNVTAEHVLVSGRVSGNIESLGRVELMESAYVDGDISYGTLGVAVGARVKGQLMHSEQIATPIRDSVMPIKLTVAAKETG